MRQTDDMSDMDYYTLLGVDRSSASKEITHAYRHLARQYHPDLHPGDAEADMRFKQINEAYRVLSDPEKRMLYDQQLAGSEPPRQPAPPTSDDAYYAHEEQSEADGEAIQGSVSDLSAALQEIAHQAADEMTAVLRDFGAELDSISRTLADTVGGTGNRASRRAFRPPPPQLRNLPPRGGRPPWNGKPPRDGRAPKP